MFAIYLKNEQGNYTIIIQLLSTKGSRRLLKIDIYSVYNKKP